MRIYLASSWRNVRQPSVLAALRAAGHDVYDFRHPTPDNDGFSWRQVSPENPRSWSPAYYRDSVLENPIAVEGFALDMTALSGADATVLALPCGRSAHLELGYAVGKSQRTFVLMDNVLMDNSVDEPELMYRMVDRICLDVPELIRALEGR